MLVPCPNCSGPLPDWFLSSARTESVCPGCYSEITLEIFPALFRGVVDLDPAALAIGEGEASCYEHASKRAVSLCGHCGRFLCALCEVSVDGAIWCPACLQLDKPQPKLKLLERQRTLYDSIALALATVPALLFYPVFVTWPIVIYLSIRYWKAPSSIVPRTKWRFVVALILAGAEMCLLVLVIIAIVAFQRRSVR